MDSNARLLVHHGYRHSSRNKSSWTDKIAKTYVFEGKLPKKQETACYADGNPDLYNTKAATVGSEAVTARVLYAKSSFQKSLISTPEYYGKI